LQDPKLFIPKRSSTTKDFQVSFQDVRKKKDAFIDPDTRVANTDVAQMKPASRLRELAILRHRSGKIDEAFKLYTAYLKGQPNDAGIWNNLGIILRNRKQYSVAVNCYRRGLEIRPDDLLIMGNLGNVLKDMHRFEESLALHRQVVEEKKDDVSALLNFACTLRENAQFEEALKHLDHAQSIQPESPVIELERALNLFYLGRFDEGWRAFEARWRTGELPVRDYGCPQWNGQPIDGKTVLLHAEQGYGDAIWAARFVPLVKDRVGASGKVFLQCKRELHRLFAKVGADVLIEPNAVFIGEIDVHCPLMSLMRCFNIKADKFPPPARLNIPPEAKRTFEEIQTRYPGKIKIGLCWSGSITFKNNENRALPLSAFLPLAEMPQVRLFSLQKGPQATELYEHGEHIFIEDIGIRCGDFADTAAAVEILDLIVMTDSSVAHLAASLNKPVINIIPEVPYWLYMPQETTTPWYPSMTLVRRKHWKDYEETINSVKAIIRRTASPS
jgi:Tfp pilus assembly protein PilF